MIDIEGNLDTLPLTADQFGNLERQFQALLGVEPGIAVGLVVQFKITVLDITAAAGTLGDVFTG